jgi:rfaE bifunctional protein nucleotidyltransferase chain/domain
MPPGPVVGAGHVTRPNYIGPRRPEAEGRDRKEGRPGFSRGTPRFLFVFILSCIYKLLDNIPLNPASVEYYFVSMAQKSINNAFQTALELKAAIEPLRKQGKTLVTTNGCFDIIHAGHIQYLAEAARLGDILAVGVNCDAVVQKLKGKGRPLQNEQDRLAIVASLRMVDFAFIFREDDPRPFLEVLRPDVHVKGGDYAEDIIEKPVVEKNGGKIKIVSFLKDHSTTSLIAKMTGKIRESK